MSIAAFVGKKSHVLSRWLLSEVSKRELTTFNTSFDALMSSADTLRQRNENPIENREWVAAAEKLRLDLYLSNTKKTYTRETVAGVTISAAFFLLLPVAHAALAILAFVGSLVFFDMQKSQPGKLNSLANDGFFSSRTRPSVDGIEHGPSELYCAQS